MKKTIILLILSFSFLKAEVFWNDIYKYESIKIDENKYQVKTINKSNFIENHLFLDKENDNLIKNAKKCQYITERQKVNTKTFSFIGDGSIQCDYEAVDFISKRLSLSEAEMSKIIVFDSVLIIAAYILIIILLIFTIIYLKTGNKKYFLIGIIISIVIYGLNLKYGPEIHKKEINNLVKHIVYDLEQDYKEIYYIDPKLLKK